MPLLWQDASWFLPAAASAAAAVFDVLIRRIPNALTYTLLSVGLIFAYSGNGLEAASVAISIVTLPALIAFSLGVLGGGDVKLLAAMGSWLDPAAAVWLLLLTVCLAAIVGVLLVLYRRFSDHGPFLNDSSASTLRAATESTIPLGLPMAMAFFLVAGGWLP